MICVFLFPVLHLQPVKQTTKNVGPGDSYQGNVRDIE